MYLHKLILYWIITIVLLTGFWYTFDTYLVWFTRLSVLGTLSIIAWTIANRIYEHINTGNVDPNGKAVLITGCDTGFGHRLAQQLDNYGFHVFAGVLFPDGDGSKRLKSNGSKRLRVIPLDVTKPNDVEAAVAQIRQSKLPLWAVVNNAGIAIGCPFDWGKDIDVYQKTFDVNVFGVVRVTNRCLPLLRQSKGRVINVASVAGRLTVPIMSHYCMAKHSVRVFSDVLRRELYNDQIEVVTIEPTFYKTPIVDFNQIRRARERIYEETPNDIREAYSSKYISSLNEVGKLVNVVTRKDVGEVIDTMMKAVTLTHPKAFYRCCGYHDVVGWAVSHLPETILDAIVNLIFHNKYSIPLAKQYCRLFESKQQEKAE